ncbi:MAG: CPBP family intramembrane metalloprotease [Verrucomicrobia bacterium]|nr:CPBP family intramembrane metalloprotease [Verrucomicrobiota bacterium]
MSWKKAFGFHIGSPLTVLTQGLFLGIAAFPVSLLLVGLIRWILEFLQFGAESQEVIKMLQQQETGAWGQVVFIGVLSIFIAPIAEEILFRGVIYVHVRDMGFPKIAALGSAVLFGMVHSNTVAFIPLVLFALFLILLYERYANLIVCIAAHASFNTANLLFSILLSGENMP